MIKSIFFFGFGYVAQRLVQFLPENCRYAGTSRSGDTFRLESLSPDILDQYDHFLISIPPNETRDSVLQYYTNYFNHRTLPVRWIGYLSTTGVYGDHQGNWVTEDTPASPQTDRSKARLLAERQWLSLPHPVRIYRLAGIYGPGRSALDNILDGHVKMIDKPGHYFNRIHVDDICRSLLATLDSQEVIFNLADDSPCCLVDVYKYAHQLLNKKIPETIPFEQASMSPMLREFFCENKRVKNDRIKKFLTAGLLYPSYKEGLQQCLSRLKKLT